MKVASKLRSSDRNLRYELTFERTEPQLNRANLPGEKKIALLFWKQSRIPALTLAAASIKKTADNAE